MLTNRITAAVITGAVLLVGSQLIAGDKTFTGLTSIIRSAQTGVAESVAAMGTSDMLANSGLFFSNNSAVDNVFAGLNEGRTNGSASFPALTISGQVLASGSGSDSGSVPILVLRGRRGDGLGSGVRPSIGFASGSTTMAQFTPGGSFSLVLGSQGLRIAEGSNAKQGIATLVAGTVTVGNTSVTASSRIFLTGQDNNATGQLRVSARTPGASFTITSSDAGATGTVAYEIFEPS